jgi:hypothetical protein
LFQVTVSSVREATNLGRVLSAVAISSAVSVDLGPGRGEHLIGLAAEKKGAGAPGPLGHDPEKPLVEIGYQPAPVPEATVAILVGTARCLHDAVQGHEGTHNQVSHVLRLVPSSA